MKKGPVMMTGAETATEERRCPGLRRTTRPPTGGSGAGTLLLLTGLAAVASPTLASPALGQESAPPEALSRLEVLEGRWATDSVLFLNAEAEVWKVSGATARNELQLDGRVMAHRGRLDDPAIETRGWYYWDREDGRLHMGSVTNGGRYDEFAGGWEGDRLVMTTLPSEALAGRTFRMTHSDFTAESFLETMEMSEDGGRTWRRTSTQRMRRVDGSVPTAGAGAEPAPAADADAARILTALDAYVGRWRTEEKEDREGRTFHFEYEVEWFDPGKTIARMHIEQVLADGSRSTVFQGYKGRRPAGDGVYYFAASPSGRGSRGEVLLDEEKVVTLYEGWTADGDVVRIRDVSWPVEDGSFLSRTFLRPSDDAEWRRIGEDRWRRVPAGGGGDR